MKSDFYFNLYKDSIDFPCPTHVSISGTSLKRVVDMLKPFVNKRTNIKVDLSAKNRIFISQFINFCKLEGIDFKSILEIEVLPDAEVCQIIVRQGIADNVKLFTI